MKQFETILNLRGKKQIIKLLDKTLRIREKHFIKEFGWIPISLYNEALQLRNEAKGPFLTEWMATLDRLLEGKPVNKIEADKIQFKVERIRGEPESVVTGRISALLYLWLWHLIKGDLIVRLCEAGDCPRIFTPAARLDQTFCSIRCRMRINMRRIKKREELRTRKAEGI